MLQKSIDYDVSWAVTSNMVIAIAKYTDNLGGFFLIYEDIDWFDLNKHQKDLILPDEVWRVSISISDYFKCGDLFEISNFGRLRRSDTNFVYKIMDNGGGYKKLVIAYKDHKAKNFYIHRLVAEVFHENPKNLPQVNHKSSGLGKFDNRSQHLEWCSGRDNILDAHSNDQMDNRTKVHTSIDIKPDDFIAKMYRRYKETNRVGETAREFGVSRTTLSSIVNKRSRIDITDKIDKEYQEINKFSKEGL